MTGFDPKYFRLAKKQKVAFAAISDTVIHSLTRAQQYLRWATVATVDMGRKEGAAMPLSRGRGSWFSV